MEDANGNRTEYEYDGHDRLYRVYFPSKTTAGTASTTDYEQYSYDDNGSLVSKRTRDGETISFTYDDLSRLTQRSVPSIDSTTEVYDFEYDLAGRRTLSAKNDGIDILYEYDAAGRLSRQGYDSGTGATAWFDYYYNEAGNRVKLVWPDKPDGTNRYRNYYVYDALGRVTRACDGGAADSIACKTYSDPLVEVSYDDLSRRTQMDYANGTSASYGYAWRGDLITQGWDLTGTADDFDYGFAYNPGSSPGQALSVS